jgi:uncharacterized membrane protein
MNSALSIIFAVAAMLGFGVADFIAKTMLTKANVYRTVLFSQSIGTLPFLVGALAYDWVVPGQSVVFLAICSGGLSAAVIFSFYKALSLGKATLVSPISSCLTVVAIVLSVSILGENLSGTQALLIIAVFCGILLVAYQTSSMKSHASNVSILFALVVVFLGGGNAIVQKWIATSSHFLLGFLLVRLFMVASLGAVFPMFRSDTRVSAGRGEYAAIVLLGVLDAFAFFAMFMGFRAGFVSIVAPIATSSAAVTIILVRIFLQERVLLHQRIGVVTIILGIALLSAVS